MVIHHINEKPTGKVEEMKDFSSKIRNKAEMPALATAIQIALQPEQLGNKEK